MTRETGRVVALFIALAIGAACGSSSNRGYDPSSSGGPGADADGSAGGDGQAFNNGEGGGPGSDGGPGPTPQCNDPKCGCALAGGTWDGTTCTITENPGNVDPG